MRGKVFSYIIAGIIVLAFGVGTAFFLRQVWTASAAANQGDAAEAQGPYHLDGDTIEATNDAVVSAAIRTSKVQPRDLPMTLTLTAKSGLNMENVTHVSAQFGGRVTDISVGLGDTVKGPGEAGGPTKLCVIESNDLAQDKANWLQTLIQLKIDEQSLQRTRELYRASVVAEKSLLDAESALMKDRAAEQAARQQLLVFGLKDDEIDEIRKEAVVETSNLQKGLEAGANRAHLTTEQIRRQRMGYVLTSPRSGVIAEKFVAGGETAVPQNNLFTVADTHTLWIWGDVYERDLQYIKVGEPMAVYFTSEPTRQRDCKVDWISPVLDPNTHSVKIRGLIDNSDGHLLSDMYGTMIITVSKGENSIVVPAEAVVRQDSNTYVFVELSRDGDKTRFRRVLVQTLPVDVGFGASSAAATAAGSSAANTAGAELSTQSVRVSSGLSAGDMIVSQGGVGLLNEMQEQANSSPPTTAPAANEGAAKPAQPSAPAE